MKQLRKIWQEEVAAGVKWTALGLFVGAVLGVLLGRATSQALSSEEFSALGTWVAALTTLAAVAVALWAASAERSDRTVQRILDQQRLAAEARRERQQVGLVQVSCTTGSPQTSEYGETQREISFSLLNPTDEPVADVHFYHPLSEFSPAVSLIRVDGGTSRSETLSVFDLPVTPTPGGSIQAYLDEGLSVDFLMFGKRWLLDNVSGLREGTDTESETS